MLASSVIIKAHSLQTTTIAVHIMCKMASLFLAMFDTQMLFWVGICDPRRTVDHTGRDWLVVAGETSATAIEVLAIACSVSEPCRRQ